MTTPSPHTTAGDDPLTLLATAVETTIEWRPVASLAHYQRRWVWPPRFTGGWEWNTLVESVRTHGVREPLIVLDDGQVVDGGHRFDAAREVGLQYVPTRRLVLPLPLSDADRFALERWAVMDTLARRHLTRRDITALVMDLEHAESTLRGQGLETPACHRRARRLERLAELIGMSPSHVKQILYIAHRGSQELRDDVRAGRIHIDAAYKALTRKIAAQVGCTPPSAPASSVRAELDQLVGDGEAFIGLVAGVARADGPAARPAAAAEALEAAAERVAELRRALDGEVDIAAPGRSRGLRRAPHHGMRGPRHAR
jgi:hypothetical protein